MQRLTQRALQRSAQLQRMQCFQRDGLEFIVSHGDAHSVNIWHGVRLKAGASGGRAMLADEMGCGKSVQAIAAMAAYDAWPVLIVCPASLR